MVSVRLFILISDMLRNVALLMMGGLMCMATLEVVLRVLPTSTYTDTGYHIDPLIITYRPHHQFRSAWGWNFRDPLDHEANNLGFLSSRDFLPDSAAVAVIGDSFVDASMLPEAERVGAQLQSALGGGRSTQWVGRAPACWTTPSDYATRQTSWRCATLS